MTQSDVQCHILQYEYKITVFRCYQQLLDHSILINLQQPRKSRESQNIGPSKVMIERYRYTENE